MYVPSELRVIGKLAGGPVVTSFAAYDLGGEPVLLLASNGQLLPEHRVQYTRWAETLVRCARHPYIADVVSHGVVQGRAYLAVRIGHRQTLAERLGSLGPVPYEQVRHLGVCIADALATAHEAGLTHLAVRPEAIYVDDERDPVLAGFDAAAPALVRPMATGPLAAPEYRVRRGRVDGRTPAVGPPADVYALAAVLYVALGGAPPLISDPASAMQGEGAVSLPDLPGVPPALVEALRSGVAVSPHHRPTAAQLRDALRDPRTRRRTGAVADPARGAGMARGGSPAPGVPPMGTPPVGPGPSQPPGSDSSGSAYAPDFVAAGLEGREPPKVPAGGYSEMEPLVGSWQIIAGTGERELMVVERNGAVTWTGADDAGPFVVMGEALPLGDGGFRLLLNDAAGGAGCFVDLMVDDGALSFTMDEAPAEGAVDVVVTA